MSSVALCPINPLQRVQVELTDDQLALVVSEPVERGESRIIAWVPAAKSKDGAHFLLEEARQWAVISSYMYDTLLKQVNPSTTRKQVSYYGVPSEPIYRYCPETDPKYGVQLSPRFDIGKIGSIEGDRRNDFCSKSQLSIAILADFLGNSVRVERLYGAFYWEIHKLTPAERRWILTETDVEKAISSAERLYELAWNEKAKCYQENPQHPPKVLANK